MTETVSHPLPGFRTVFPEQVRVVGLAVRREALLLVAGLCLIAVLALADVLEDGGALNAMPVPPIAMIALGALAPFAVWKGERVFGGAHLWTLPVGRRKHALAKVAAGGAWLLVAVAGIQLFILAAALLSGGEIVERETRMLVGPGGPADLTPVAWSTQPWQWATPFTIAFTCYLIGSAFMLGVKYPLRWGTAAVAGFIALGLLADLDIAGGLPELLFEAVAESRLGMGPAMSTGIADELEGRPPAPGSNASVLVLWYQLPSFERWAPAALFWLALAAGLLWIAASRHREH